MPVLRHWRIFDLDGLDDTAEADRDRLLAYLCELDATARRYVERRDARARPA
jgi:acyl-[acyl-carrier-protein] desaturase